MTFALHMLEKEVADQKVNTMPAIMADFEDSLFHQPMDLMDCMSPTGLGGQTPDQLSGPGDGQAADATVPYSYTAEDYLDPDVSAGPSCQPSCTKDISEVKSEQGACGLHNLGNTCFMNAGLQCMLSNAQLCSFILDAPPGSIQEDSLCGLFAALVHKVWSGRYSYLKPRKFKDRLGHQFPQFKGFRQHDGQEFLALLLDSLHEELNKSHKLVQKNSLPLGSPVVRPLVSTCEEHSEESRGSVTSMDIPSPTSHLLLLEGDPTFGTDSDTATTLPNFEEYLMKDTKTLNTNLQTTYTLNNEKSVKSPPRVENLSHRKVHNTAHDNVKLNNKDTNLMAEKQGNCCAMLQGTGRGDLPTKGQNINNKRLKVDSASSQWGPTEEEPKRRATDFISNISNNQLALSGCHGAKCKVTSNFMSKNELNPTLEVLNKMGFSMSGVKGGEAAEVEEVSKLELQDCSGETEADLVWRTYVSHNQSVVVDTFQGQFKSTVTCSVCSHPSVTYEPFMYLSVPLPRATEKQIVLTWVPCHDTAPVRYCVTVQEYGKVVDLKMALLVLLGGSRDQDMQDRVVLAEVLDHHISRTLDDGTLLRYVNTANREICGFEVTQLRPVRDSPRTPPGSTVCAEYGPAPRDQGWAGLGTVSPWRSCAVCLEEMADNQLLTHEPGCGCCLCDNCIELTSKHYLSRGFQCPVCCISVDPSLGFRRLVSSQGAEANIRIVQVSVMFRHDYTENGQQQMTLLGYPRVLYAPSELDGADLLSAVQQFLPVEASFSVLLTDGQGSHCSRCMFNVHCTGCELPREGPTSLKPGDHLTVRFTQLCAQHLDTTNHVLSHSSMKDYSSHTSVLTLEESFKAFTESEELDEHNPWYCSRCRQNQPARKTLKVCRFPETLVVYLKRFVFHQLTGIKINSKVLYPLEALDVSALQDESCASCPPTYDLQSCILHFGGVNAGHYTCFTKHPLSSSWRYYNDETVSQLQPSEEDAQNVYVLFYQRKGTPVSFRPPSPLLGDRSPTPSPPQSPCVTNLGSPNIMEDINDMLRDYSTTQGGDVEAEGSPFFGADSLIGADSAGGMGMYDEVTGCHFPGQQEDMLKFDLYS